MRRRPPRSWTILLASIALASSRCSSTATTDAAQSADSSVPDAAWVTADGTDVPHIAFPQIPANAGTVLTSATLVTIAASNDTLAAMLFASSDALVASRWWATVAPEYGLEPFAQSVHVTGPALTTNVTQSDAQAYLTNLVANRTAPAPDGHTLYVFYLPDGTSLVAEDGTIDTTCARVAGFHAPYGADGDAWAIVQRCPAVGTTSEFVIATVVGSHEVIEGASDPTPGQGYTLGWVDSAPWNDSVWRAYDATGYIENADLCEGSRIAEGGFVFQRIWSNRAAALGGDPCAPAIATPYYSVAAPRAWYPIAAGASVAVPLTGWSTGGVADWELRAHVKSTNSADAFTAVVDSATHTTIGMTYPTTNDGRTSVLTITAPAAAATGTWAVATVHSFRLDPATTWPDPTGDQFHAALVGVYVR